MPSIATEMTQLEGLATKWQAVAEPSVPTAAPRRDWLDETVGAQLHHGVQVDDMSQEDFDKHFAPFVVGVQG